MKPIVKKTRVTKPSIPTPNARKENTTNLFGQIKEAILESFDNEDTPIRIRGLLRKRKETLQEFLIKFFTKWNIERDTIWVRTGETQTEADKKRSLGDIYMICKYYYPDCTLNELILHLYDSLPEYFEEVHDETGFRTCVCQQIHKRVWWYEEGDANNVNHKTTNDEYGKPYRFYLDNLEE